MEVLTLAQQKEAVLFAPKDLLWKILDEEDAWLQILGILPEEYYDQFLSKLRLLGVEDANQIRNMAKIYVRNKVHADHLQEAVAIAWHPTNLEESTSWLKENEFLERPLGPMNLTAESAQAKEAGVVYSDTIDMPMATRLRLARAAEGMKPKVGHPPDGASAEALKCWNKVLRCPKRKRMIYAPAGIHDQWAMAHKFWLQECVQTNVPAYKGPAGGSSSSLHAATSLHRSMSEMHNSLCYDGYTMSRPAARTLRKLYDQLAADGYELGPWNPIRPKTPRGI